MENRARLASRYRDSISERGDAEGDGSEVSCSSERSFGRSGRAQDVVGGSGRGIEMR